MRTQIIMVISLLLGACLRVPPPLPDAADTEDASPARPSISFAVEALAIEDFRGAEHPLDAIPRRPVAVVRFNTLPFVEHGEEPPFWLLQGPPDDSLAEDLGRAPLRIATRARILPTTLERDGPIWTLTTDQHLLRQSEVTLAVAGWVRSENSGETLGPYLSRLLTSAAPQAGAQVSASWPPDGAASVSPALIELALRFDGPVELPPGSLTLHEGARSEDAELSLVPCESVGWDGGWCARLRPERPLRRGTTHRLVLDASALDAAGAPVGPFEVAFSTALSDDEGGPSLRLPSCAIDETVLGPLCVLADEARIVVRLAAGEPARIALELDGRTVRLVAPRGDAALEIDGLVPATSFPARLIVRDTADRALELAPSLQTTEPLAHIAIVEVRADPNGPEPTQEYVEVLNFGAVPIDLEGFHLADRTDAEGDPLRGMLAPSERALIVPSGFDPEETSDPVVPPGVALIRVDRSLGSGGLANAGEPLFLRDAEGRRVSAAPARSTGGGGRCLVRQDAPMRTTEGFAVATCTPGIP